MYLTRMKITVNANVNSSAKARNKLVAQVCQSVNKFLSENEPLEISFQGDVPLKDVGQTLYNLAELVTGVAGMVKNPKESEDYDDADAWKYDNDE